MDESQTTGGVMRPRGERRRRELIEAGVELLGEAGWSALTSRAVAERAGAPQGLVHYHFGGLQPLKRAIAASVMAELVDPVVQLLIAHTRWAEGVAAVVQAGQTLSPAQARLTTELMSAALKDPEVAELMRGVQDELRSQLITWLTAIGAPEAEGLAVVTAALLDGLVLHRLIDDSLPLDAAVRALQGLVPR